MSKIFEIYKELRGKLQSRGKRKQTRESYAIFEEYLNSGFYGEAALIAFWPELEGQIPIEKINNVQKGLLNIINKLEKIK